MLRTPQDLELRSCEQLWHVSTTTILYALFPLGPSISSFLVDHAFLATSLVTQPGYVPEKYRYHHGRHI
jgi:hypothetical protein